MHILRNMAIFVIFLQQLLKIENFIPVSVYPPGRGIAAYPHPGGYVTPG